MQSTKGVFLAMVTLCGLLCLPAQAATMKKSSTEEALAIKILAAPDALITRASARQEGEYAVVEGQIRRKNVGGKGIVKGHVDIKLHDAQGKIVGEEYASCTPRIIPNRGTLTSSFRTRIPLTDSRGNHVSVRFHNGPHNG